MPSVTSQYVNPPADVQGAELIVDWLTQNPTRNAPVLQDSIRVWERNGCHLLAWALKGSPQFGYGHQLGATMRTVCNLAIMREHKLSIRST